MIEILKKFLSNNFIFLKIKIKKIFIIHKTHFYNYNLLQIIFYINILSFSSCSLFFSSKFSSNNSSLLLEIFDIDKLFSNSLFFLFDLIYKIINNNYNYNKYYN